MFKKNKYLKKKLKKILNYLKKPADAKCFHSYNTTSALPYQE